MPEEKKGQPERLPHETGAVTFRPFHGSWRPWSALTEPEGDQNETNAAPCYQKKWLVSGMIVMQVMARAILSQ